MPAHAKKVVLFPYDKDEYLCDRGMYMDMDDLPFPQVFDLDALVDELRSEKELRRYRVCKDILHMGQQ